MAYFNEDAFYEKYRKYSKIIMQPKIKYQIQLDSLRGVAAVLIVLLHFSTYLFPGVGDAIPNITPALKRTYLFVDMFFI